MKRLMLFLSAVLILAPGMNAAQPPGHFELLQNVPNPFCPSDIGGITDIRFALPQQSEVLLEVWNPDTTAVVRTLVQGALAAGYHSMAWDGSDDGGSDLVAGTYPYSLTAIDPDSGDTLFQNTLAATIDCTVASKTGTWGRIKAGFRRE